MTQLSALPEITRSAVLSCFTNHCHRHGQSPALAPKRRRENQGIAEVILLWAAAEDPVDDRPGGSELAQAAGHRSREDQRCVFFTSGRLRRRANEDREDEGKRLAGIAFTPRLKGSGIQFDKVALWKRPEPLFQSRQLRGD